MSILNVEGVNTFYGDSHILFEVSFNVEAQQCVCLLGRNGAGKTTTFRSILNLTPPRSGRIAFAGNDLSDLPPHMIASKGVGWVPEGRDIFPMLTVDENLGVVRSLNTGDWTLSRVYEFFPRLADRKKQRGSSLSGGEQQMLTIARTLLLNPRLLLLDEPSEGLAPLIVTQIGELVSQLTRSGMTILMAEQNVKFVKQLADKVIVLDDGRVREEFVRKQWQQHPALLHEALSLSGR